VGGSRGGEELAAEVDDKENSDPGWIRIQQVGNVFSLVDKIE
jgi:hypothetical protein